MKTRRNKINENQKVTLTFGQLKRLVRESLDEAVSLADIYDFLKSEYDGSLFSDNFLRVHIDMDGGKIVCTTDLAKPDDLDETNDEDMEWWQDKVWSSQGLLDEIGNALVDKFCDCIVLADDTLVGDELREKAIVGTKTRVPRGRKMFVVDCSFDDEERMTVFVSDLASSSPERF